MTDPTWNWVFKNTFDAMEEQLNKVPKNPKSNMYINQI